MNRRNNLDTMTPAERAIYEAVHAVEEAGAHPLLTEAVDLLTEARARVADYVDRVTTDPTRSPGVRIPAVVTAIRVAKEEIEALHARTDKRRKDPKGSS